MFGSICPCGIEGFAWLDKREIFVLSDSACVYERAGQQDARENADIPARIAFKLFATTFWIQAPMVV